ncbi:MAG: hypothetical protein ACFCD0_24710 [Gemmataceae bacterium]
MRNLSVRTVFVAVATFVVSLVAACPSAQAQRVPFAINGGGAIEFVPLPGVTTSTVATHITTGLATYLGAHVSRGKVEVLAADPTTGVGTFQSVVPTIFASQRGLLAFDYGRLPGREAPAPGVVRLVPVQGGTKVVAVWDAQFTLSNAVRSRIGHRRVTRGSFRMIATTEPFVLGSQTPVRFSWRGTGTITFGR